MEKYVTLSKALKMHSSLKVSEMYIVEDSGNQFSDRIGIMLWKIFKDKWISMESYIKNKNIEM